MMTMIYNIFRARKHRQGDKTDDMLLTHDYLRRVLALIRSSRAKIELQENFAQLDDLEVSLSSETQPNSTVILSHADAVIYTLLQDPNLHTLPRKISLTKLERMNNKELVEWSQQLIDSVFFLITALFVERIWS